MSILRLVSSPLLCSSLSFRDLINTSKQSYIALRSAQISLLRLVLIWSFILIMDEQNPLFMRSSGLVVHIRYVFCLINTSKQD